jgi:hypothetical protein
MFHPSVRATRALMALALTAGLALMVLPSSAQPPVAPGTTPQTPKHHASHMHAALHELKEARLELKEAKHDFGGHREAALKAVDHAIHQIEVAIEHHKK